MIRIALLAIAAGCYHPVPVAGAPCGPNGECPTGLACSGGFCTTGDANVSIDACPVISCTGNDVVDCTGTHTCSHGCATSGAPHCLALAPSNGLTTALLAGATAAVAGVDLDFDTDTGEIVDGNGSIVRSAGTGVIAGIGFSTVGGQAVFAAQSFSVPATSTWGGGGEPPLVLFAASSIVVNGTIDVGDYNGQGGPNGTAGSLGDVRTMCEGKDGRYKTSISAGAGAGGGGGATAGGAGGDTAADASGSTAGGAGGAMCITPSTIPLRGGNGGGAGGTESMVIKGGAGGGGGGAIALVAMTTITIYGVVGAPGGGGQTIAMGAGGGGAGGGGAVFVESPDVTISGVLTANGGGGGPASNGSASPVRGPRGHINDAIPAGGAPAAGAGGAGTTAPTNGSTQNSSGAGGGGGGAVGTIEIKAITTNLTSSLTSPTARNTQAALE